MLHLRGGGAAASVPEEKNDDSEEFKECVRELKEVLKTLGRKDTTDAELRELIGETRALPELAELVERASQLIDECVRRVVRRVRVCATACRNHTAAIANVRLRYVVPRRRMDASGETAALIVHERAGIVVDCDRISATME